MHLLVPHIQTSYNSVMGWGIVSFFCVLVGTASAADSGKFVLSAERDLYGFRGQQAFLYEANQLRFVRNSNFLCKPTDEVLLGVFHTPLTAARKAERAYLFEIAERIPKSIGNDDTPLNVDPHRVRYFIGEQDVTADQENAQTVDRILTVACSDPAPSLSGPWVAEQGALVKHVRVKGENALEITELDAGKKGATKVQSFKETHCIQLGKTRWKCPIDGHGLVMFEVKP
jgi:hypothetical protein